MRSLLLTRWRAHIRYHDIQGAGRPLVFVHGLGCASSSDYPRVAGHHLLSGRRRLLIDLLGSGFSDQPAEFSYGITAHADTVLAVLEALDVSRADVFGHSMGGAVAIAAAAQRPERVSRLILSEPNLDPGGGFFSRQIASQSEDAYVEAGHAQMIRDAEAGGNDVWAATMRASLPVAVHRAACSLVEGSDPSWRQQLAALEMPRTVLFGARSMPDQDTEQLPRLGVRVAIVTDAGHSMAWENPEGVAAAIAEVLA